MERITNTKATVVVATKVPAKKIIDCWLDGFKMKPHNFMKFRWAPKVRPNYSFKIA